MAKKIPITDISRNNERYTYFDNEEVKLFDKEIQLYERINNFNGMKIVKEFMNPKNYNDFIEDLEKIITYSNEGYANLCTSEIIEKIHSFDWNVEAIENYLEEIITTGNNTLLSFMHIQNFTEHIIYYPYARNNSEYQKHTRHLIEIDFKQSKKDIKKYIDKIYENLKFERNKYESDNTQYFSKRVDFNFGDYLFTYDGIKYNYSYENIEYAINEYRVNEHRKLTGSTYSFENIYNHIPKITTKKIAEYAKKLKADGFN